MSKQIIITGTVLGTIWDGSKATYPIQSVSAPTRKKAMQMIESRLSMGKLTATGDFTDNIGAMLTVKTIHTIYLKGKPFINEEVIPLIFIGEMTDEEYDVLLSS